MKRRQFYFWLGLLLWLPALAGDAASPAWWTTSGVVSTNQVTNDYAVINLGQLKNMATQAKAQMDANLPGGSGSNVTALINGFTPPTNNYFSANIGQLKNIAKPFYDRLIAVGYTNAYPWPAGTNDYAVANVGQLKYLFSWSVSATTLGDGIPDWWRQHYFGSGSTTSSTSCASCDPDTDGWSNVEEYLNGTNPFQADPGITNFDFIVNGGQLYSTSLTVRVQGVLTNYPNILVSLDPRMSNNTMLANSGTHSYTLPDTGDGIQEIFLQYAFSPQQPVGPIVSKVVNVDRTPPVVYITSPASTAILNQAFMALAAVAYDPNPVLPDASRPISIFINGQQFWGRSGTNINIDLFPVPSGTNSFTATIVVTDQAGNSNQTSRTWTVDPSTATNAPNILTVNITTNMLLPDVESIWVEGSVDNSNALVNALVSSESGDVTTNSLNVWKAHYEGLVPLESGTNQLFLVAANAAGYMTSKSFTAIRSTRFQAAITNPVFGVFATVPSNTVSGYVNALFDAGLPTQTNITSILINGVPAMLGTNTDASGNVGFWTTNVVGLGNPITAQLRGPGISANPALAIPPAQSQTYEVTHKLQTRDSFIGKPTPSSLSEPFGFFSGFWTLWLNNGCWTPTHSGNTVRSVTNVIEDLNLATSNVQSNTSVARGNFPDCDTAFDVDTIPWNMSSPALTSSTVPGAISRGMSFGIHDYQHGQGTVQGAVYTDTPNVYENVTVYYRALQRRLDSGGITFIAPREYSTNTTVIFTFEGVDYQRPDGVAPDLSQVKYHGQDPIAYSNAAQTVSYLLTVDGGKEYTINPTDFQWPSFQQLHHETKWHGPATGWVSLAFVGDWTEEQHWLTWTNFHNAAVRLRSDKAALSPVVFSFGRTDLGDPCDQSSKAVALVVYYKSVVNTNFEVQPFDVFLEVTDTKLPTPQWSKHAGPNSGTLSSANSATATFSNPSKGGVYQFDLALGGQTTRTQLWLPVAGPDISYYWNNEIDYFKSTWGPAYQSKLDTRTSLLSMAPVTRLFAKHAFALKDMLAIGINLDWTGQVKGTQTPCGGPNLTGDEWRQTMYGIVIDFRKRNNMMYTLIGREMGLLESELKYSPDLLGAGSKDDQYVYASYTAGFYLYNGNGLQDVMQSLGHGMQVPGSWSQKEWPSDEVSQDGLTRKAADQLNQLIQ